MGSYLDVFWGTATPPILTPNPTHKPLLTAEQKSLQADGLDKNVNLPRPPAVPTLESELFRLRGLTPSKRQVALAQLKNTNPSLHQQLEQVLRQGVATTPARQAPVAVVTELDPLLPAAAPPGEPVTEFGEPVVQLTPQEQLEARQRAIRLKRLKASESGTAGMMTQG